MVDIPQWFRDKNFKLQKDITKLPPYFYLDWENKSAKFFYTKEELKNDVTGKILYISKVTLRDSGDILLLCINTRDKHILCTKNKTNINKHIVSILKSHLQKCIRRKKTDLAVKCTAYFIKQNDLETLLRRLVIIVIEDTILNPNLPIIVWFMIQSKYNNFDKEVHEWILAFVKQITELKIWDNFIYCNDKKLLVKDKTMLEDMSKLNTTDSSVLISLLIRYNYGGMTGDKELILQTVNIWLKRIKENQKIFDNIYNLYNEIPKITDGIKNVKEFKKNDILLEAFDFHCCSIINDIKKEINIDDQYLKQIIWNFNSSVNLRNGVNDNKFINKKDENIWQQIKPKFIKIAEKYKNNIIL